MGLSPYLFFTSLQRVFDRNNYLYFPSWYLFLLQILRILSTFMILILPDSKTMTIILISLLNSENSKRIELQKFHDPINYYSKWLLVSSYFNILTKTDSKYLNYSSYWIHFYFQQYLQCWPNYVQKYKIVVY